MQSSVRGRRVSVLTFLVSQHFSHTRQFEDRQIRGHLVRTNRMNASTTSGGKGARVSVVAHHHHRRIAMMRIPSTSTTSSPHPPPREKTFPEGRSHRPFFAVRLSSPSTLPQLRHLIDSVFYASTHQRAQFSSKKFATLKDGAGACAFPRADSQKTWSACSRSWRNSRSNWARCCRE